MINFCVKGNGYSVSVSTCFEITCSVKNRLVLYILLIYDAFSVKDEKVKEKEKKGKPYLSVNNVFLF